MAHLDNPKLPKVHSYVDVPRVEVGVDDVTLEKVDNVLRVKDSGITTAKLADKCLTVSKFDPYLVVRAPMPEPFTTSSTSFVDVSGSEISAAVLARYGFDEPGWFVEHAKVNRVKLYLIVSGYNLPPEQIKLIARNATDTDLGNAGRKVYFTATQGIHILFSGYDSSDGHFYWTIPSETKTLRLQVKTDGTSVTIKAIYYIFWKG